MDTFGFGSFVLDASLRAAAAAVAVAVVLRLLRVRAVAVRHAAWSAVLIAMLLMPVLPSVVPALPVPMPAGAATLLSDESPAGVLSFSMPSPDVVTTTSSPRSGDDVWLVTARPEPLPSTPSARQWLPLAVFAAYLSGLVVFLSRLLHGWHLASRMIRRARRGGPIRAGVTGTVYESPEVAVPVTAGAIRPIIVLPVTWKAWDADTLAAVVAHEAAHVRRHDALISLAARLNRAIFWFHPLAWWLERTLAVTAEHACDEAAARAIAAPRRYAEILVEMADVVRRNGGRVAWQAVGVNGAGMLDSRIDRLLRGEAFASTSGGKKIAVGITCALAILTIIACRQQISATPLREDPELANRHVEQDKRMKKFEAARDMTQPQADALEQRLAANAQDFDAREQLVFYYSASSNVAWEKKLPGLRRHALWLIEHHPEHDLRAPSLSPEYDPEGFAAAKKLWETHLAKPDVSPFLVYRAAAFFAPHDKPYAEQLILRGMSMDPESAALRARMRPDVGGYEWETQLSSLYAAAILGSESVWGTYNDLRTHLERVNSAYAVEVQRKLESAKDARLLARVGNHLVRPRESITDPGINDARDKARALGIRYLERAIEINPDLELAKTSLFVATHREQTTDADRLANRAHERYMQSEDIAEYHEKNPTTAKAQRDEAKRQAEQAVDMATTHSGDAAYSAAVMTAHHVLASIALREGDRERAVHHMRESVKVPASEQIQYAPPFSWMRPVNYLLKEGERERVVEFLEAFARLTVRDRERLLRDAQAIREGRMPSSYQLMIMRQGDSSSRMTISGSAFPADSAGR